MIITVLWLSAVLVGLTQASVTSGVVSYFEYRTDELLKNNDIGYIAAFGDYNADEMVDIFVIGESSQHVDVLLAKKNQPYERVESIISYKDDTVITSVVPADYDGDVQMDILVTTRQISDTEPIKYSVAVHWGTHANQTSAYVINSTIVGEPLVFDFNADMLPDLLVEPEPGVRKVWLAQRNRTFIEYPFMEGNQTMPSFSSPQSHAFVDLNQDLAADLLLTTTEGYEVWINQNGHFQQKENYSYPDTLSVDGHIGQSSFADLDQDMMLEHILPGCEDKDCQKSVVLKRFEGEWIKIMDTEDFVVDGQTWNFVPPSRNKYRENSNHSFPISLRTTDYNLDGFPDTLAVLTNATGSDTSISSKAVQRVFLLDNVACRDKKQCDKFKRTFQLKETDDPTDPTANINKRIVVGTFYDIYEDGIPDLMMVAMVEKSSRWHPHLIFFKNDIALDSCFVKVTVVSGLCYKDCPKQDNPFGVNYPGPTIKYETTRTDGTKQRSSSTQLYQTANFALQTPYQTIGLGDMPNFLETLQAGIPWQENQGLLNRSWPFIIPNSQLIVIPNPPDYPYHWQLKLYVTPSDLVYLTGAALLGTVGFVAGIVGILQWREKREDMLEKKHEAQKFHFDAM